MSTACSSVYSSVYSSVPAFPGAEGGGAESLGGRGGRIIEVTNLNADGPGSFKAACEASGSRIVVFRVGGIIDGNGSYINISSPYITIAGQTAPGGGILIKGFKEIYIRTHDVIVRFLRVRQGGGPWEDQNGHAFALVPGTANVIIDHCSASWANDENVAAWSNYEPSPHHITFSYNYIAEGTTYGHGSCGLIVGSNSDPEAIHDISIHHNIFQSHMNRMPLVKCGNVRIINNLIYNWNWYPTGIGGGAEVDVIGNKYKIGPDNQEQRNWEVWAKNYAGTQSSGLPGDPSIYITNNIGPHQADPDGDNWGMIMECSGTGWGNPKGHPPDRETCERLTPLVESTPPITIHSVLDIENMLLANAGASRRLDESGNWISNYDAVDKRLVQEYLSGTGQIPYDENSVGGYPTIAAGTPYTDTDSDGMPNAWENIHGFNPDDPSDGPQDADNDGYTNVEEFLNGTCPDDQSFNFYGVKQNMLHSLIPHKVRTT
jgi:pectate lyase